MSEAEKKLMAEYGITSAPETIYYYKSYRYDKLADALKFAKRDNEQPEAPAAISKPA